MLKKLKSVSKSLKGSLLLSALKSIIATLILVFSHGHPARIVIFLILAFCFYIQPLFNMRQFLASFLILIFASSTIVSKLYYLMTIQPHNIVPALFYAVSILLFGILFYVLLGIKNLIFIKRKSLFYLLNGFLFLLVFILFFGTGKSDNFFLKYLAVGLSSFFLFKESFGMAAAETTAGSKNTRFVIALIFSYLILQFSWAISLLPIGFLNSASLSLLIVLMFQDLVVNHWNGTLDRRIILRNVSIFLTLAILIFAVSRWSI